MQGLRHRITCAGLMILAVPLAFLAIRTVTAPEPGETGDFVRLRRDIPAWDDPGSDTVLIERRSFGDYVFESVGIYRHARFSISRNGRVVFASQAAPDDFIYHYRAGHRTYAGLHDDYGEDPESRAIPMGTDITGDGTPNLLVTSVRDGNAGLWCIDLFNIGREFRHIQQLSGYGGDLVDINDNGAMEYVFGDSGFGFMPSYTGGGRAYTPRPKVILSYQNGQYRLDAGLMLREPPGEADLERLVGEIRAVWPDEGVQLDIEEHSAPIEFISTVISLVYQGNLNAAQYLTSHAVPDYARDGVMTEILPAIGEAIDNSSHADGIRRMNGVDTFWPRISPLPDRM